MIERFGRQRARRLLLDLDDHEELIARRKDLGDHPIPAGNSSAALGLLRLAALSGERRYEEWAEGVLRLLHPAATRHPDGFGHLLQALDFHLEPTREVALVAPADGDPAPRLAISPPSCAPISGPGWCSPAAPRGPTHPELMRDRPAVEGKPSAYVCEGFACQAPVTDPAALIAQIGDDGAAMATKTSEQKARRPPRWRAATSRPSAARTSTRWSPTTTPGGGGPIHGLVDLKVGDNYRPWFENLFRAFPDWKFEILTLIAEDDKAAVEWRRDGDLQRHRQVRGHGPQRRQLDIQGCDVVTIREGRISTSTPTRAAPRSPASSARCRRRAQRRRARDDRGAEPEDARRQGPEALARVLAHFVERDARRRPRPARRRGAGQTSTEPAPWWIVSGAPQLARRAPAPPSRSPRPRRIPTPGAKLRARIVPASSSTQAQA